MRSEQARLEAALRHAGEQLTRRLKTNARADRLRDLIRAVPFAILVTDDHRRYIEANQRATRLLGYTRDQLLNLHIPQVIAAADFASTGPRWSRFRQSGVQEGEIALRRRDDSIVVVSYWARTDVLPGHHISILSRSVGTIDEVRSPVLATRLTAPDRSRARTRPTTRRT